MYIYLYLHVYIYIIYINTYKYKYIYIYIHIIYTTCIQIYTRCLIIHNTTLGHSGLIEKYHFAIFAIINKKLIYKNLTYYQTPCTYLYLYNCHCVQFVVFKFFVYRTIRFYTASSEYCHDWQKNLFCQIFVL